jgi:hypothetical protein
MNSCLLEHSQPLPATPSHLLSLLTHRADQHGTRPISTSLLRDPGPVPPSPRSPVPVPLSPRPSALFTAPCFHPPHPHQDVTPALRQSPRCILRSRSSVTPQSPLPRSHSLIHPPIGGRGGASGRGTARPAFQPRNDRPPDTVLGITIPFLFASL